MARANRRDSNEAQIVAYLRSVGATVLALDPVDLCVGFRGVNFLMEVKKHKTPGMSRHQHDLKAGPQATLHREWRGQICVVRDVAEAATVLGLEVLE